MSDAITSPPRSDTGPDTPYAELLGTHRRLNQEQLARILRRFFSDLADRCQQTPEESDGATYDASYEVSVLLRQRAESLVASITTAIDDLYRDLAPVQEQYKPEDEPAMEVEELDLVDIGEFETALAINRIVTRVEERFSTAMEALTIRLAILTALPPLKLRLPIHLRQLCRVLQQKLQGAQLPQDTSIQMVKRFIQQCSPQLEEYYRNLNEHLSQAGVRPDLEKEIASKGSLLKQQQSRESKSRRSTEETHGGQGLAQDTGTAIPRDSRDTVEATGVESSSGPGRASTRPPTLETTSREGQLFQSVIDALRRKRAGEESAAEALPAGDSVPDTKVDIDASQNLVAPAVIARGLGSLQQDPAARAALQETASLREYLAGVREHIPALRDSDGFADEGLDLLDLVDNLFGTIGSHPELSAAVKPALRDLQIPVAKLALLEQDFFIDPDHIGRRFIDGLSGLAGSANFPNKALEREITSIIAGVIRDYDTDSAVFASALDRISQLETQQENLLARNVERVVRSREGEEQLRLARDTVDGLLHTHLAGADAPTILLDLVESGWRDLLVLIALQQGRDSEALQSQFALLRQLREHLLVTRRATARLVQAPETDAQLSAGLESLEEMFELQLPTEVSHRKPLLQLREMLAGRRDIELSDSSARLRQPAISPRALSERLKKTPRLKRWVNRATELEIDTWLSTKDATGKRRRMRLAWINETRDRFLFVGDRGQKETDCDLVGLARLLSHGATPASRADDLTIVDQSLLDTLEEAQRTLSFSRNHDSLTSLVNRETFTQQIARAIRQAQQRQNEHVLLYLDIDKFALVNDIYQRENGDQVLLEFAQLLSQLHGSKTSSARLDGDEFAVLLLDRNLDQGLQAAEKIRADIERSAVDIEGESISFTVSIGAAPISEHSAGVDHVITAAREAVAQAKTRGGNCVASSRDQAAEEAPHPQARSRTRQELEKAISGKRFILRGQRISRASTRDGREQDDIFEMLLALRNDSGQLISPTEFIDSAEHYGFMHMVDRWVIREAFSWISELNDRQKVVPRLNINLSAASVVDDSFLDYILNQISEFGVGTSRICFEITETGAITNLVKAADFVRTLRKIGCKFAIDDFGTGLANHDYLRDLPVDYVKIDGSFVRQMHHNREDFAMVQSINNLAHFLGRKTIAEWVENEAILNCLREIDVDYLQGWELGPPRPLAEITGELANIEK